MSISVNLAGGTVASILLASLLVQAFPEVGQPLTVHELSYADGMVTVDRTVVTDDDFFFMQKTAYLVDTTTSESLDICEGTKTQWFPAGRVKSTVPLGQWSGNPNCHDLPPGTYIPVAVYSWGDHRETFNGPRFTIPATRQEGK